MYVIKKGIYLQMKIEYLEYYRTVTRFCGVFLYDSLSQYYFTSRRIIFLWVYLAVFLVLSA